MRRLRGLAPVLLVAVLLGCGPPAPVDTPEPAAPITGAQLDRMQQAARAARLDPAEWVNVLRADDAARAIVHARLGRDRADHELEAYCDSLRATLTSELQPGQKLELYLVQSDGVAACR